MAKKRVKKVTKHATVSKTTSTLGDSVENVIAAALSAAPTATPPVLIKVCRLCETKDGPFLNIFDADKVTAKKVQDLMPFGIAENDDLPHKICFRCSAKVEELHEFIQKCIKTQENLREAMGKQGPLTMKHKVFWEKHLHKTNMSNDDICDELIKQAMEGILLDAPLDEVVDEKPQPSPSMKIPKTESSMGKEESESESDEDDDAISLKQVKQAIEKADEVPPRVSRSSRKPPVEAIVESPKPTTQKIKTYPKKTPNVETKLPEPPKAKPAEVVEIKQKPIEEKPKETPQPTNNEKKEEEKPTKPFNIMDHVSTIKVNQVGVLFQCKLCNRNFLKKDIVMNHGCAKNHGPPKETSSANARTPGPPKPPTVQYIKMESIKKPLSSLLDKTVEKIIEQPLPAKPPVTEPEINPKPKIGPASRVKAKPEQVAEPPPPKALAAPEVPRIPPSVSFPAAPSLNSRYKLVPGPNNTFQLVEESTVPEETPVKQPEKSRKRHHDTSHSKPKHSKEPIEKSSSPEVIDLDDNQETQREPYPVGLFQPVPHHSSVSSKPPVPFTTPAMKKQSYTIVQTGNPSKLLISTKAQPVEEPAKKKSKKKIEVVEKELLKVTSEPVAATGENRGVFTFVSLNAADILKPSYMPPSQNIIQESQITTSSAVKPAAVEKASDNYSCNMCGETFTREKKLLSHIQSHYNQMDQEDERRTGKPGPKRRTRKS